MASAPIARTGTSQRRAMCAVRERLWRGRPAVVDMVEGLRGSEREVDAVPYARLHLDVAARYPQHVEGVGLAARARRERGAGLHHERGDSRNPVAVGRVADVRGVQVTREKEVGTAARELLEGHARAPHDLVLLAAALR